jgi:hypothetical protein
MSSTEPTEDRGSPRAIQRRSFSNGHVSVVDWPGPKIFIKHKRS